MSLEEKSHMGEPKVPQPRVRGPTTVWLDAATGGFAGQDSRGTADPDKKHSLTSSTGPWGFVTQIPSTGPGQPRHHYAW